MAGKMGKKLIEFYYDVVSPYSWLAFETLCRYRSYWNIDLMLKPVFLGAIMKETGNKPPGMLPVKAEYLNKDVIRESEYFQVPLKLPSDPVEVMFIKGSLQAQRFLTSIDMVTPQHTEALSRELWLRIHNRDEDITKDESFFEAARKADVSDSLIQKTISAIRSDAVKDRLRSYTSEALKHGAFGVPTIVVHLGEKKEMIFGSDRFPVLARILDEHWLGPNPEQPESKL